MAEVGLSVQMDSRRWRGKLTENRMDSKSESARSLHQLDQGITTHSHCFVLQRIATPGQ
jgi:hypothetical protein